MSISDVCLYSVDCPNRTAPAVDYQTPYKMLRTTNVRGGFVDTQNLRCVTEATYETWTRRLKPEIGDVILTREAPLGDVGRITTDELVFLGQRLFHYRADPKKLDSLFLTYVLQSKQVQGWIKGVGFGATVQHAKVADFLRIPIPLPKLEIQSKIGAILSAYDDLIENNRRRIALLEESAQQLYKEWFVRFRFPGHEHVKIIDGVPEGWERKTVAALSSFLSRGITPNYDDDAVGWIINQKCIRDSKVNLEPAKPQSKVVPELKLVRKFDVLVNSTGAGTLGRVAQNFHECENLTVDSHVTIVRPDHGVAPVWFGLSMTLKQDFIATLGRGATNQTELSRDDIGAIALNVPTRVLLLDFEDQAAKTAEMVMVLMTQNRQLIKARDLLLPKLMSGALSV